MEKEKIKEFIRSLGEVGDVTRVELKGDLTEPVLIKLKKDGYIWFTGKKGHGQWVEVTLLKGI